MVQPAEPATLTPDFYTYDWIEPERVDLGERFVTVVWADGVRLEAFDLWLRENAVGSGGVDPATREGLLDPAEIDPTTRVAMAWIRSDGAVRVRFSPGDVNASYHPGWLRHVAERNYRPDSWLPEPEPWTAGELAEPPTHDGPLVVADDEALRAWLNDLVKRGIARLRGLPDDVDIASAVAARVGPVRETNFGPIWDVKADIALAGHADTNSTANSTLRLGPHTDLPTRETPPGFQFLHCLVNTTSGGFSTMADGAAVVAEVRELHPEHYDALTTLRWVFFNRGPGIDHRWSGPAVDLGVPGSPLTLRAFYPVKGFPDMDPADMPRAYDALRVFSELAAQDRFQMRYPFAPGDLVAFDNRRILHGRDAYDSGGSRHLRGIYMDHDEIHSTTRVLNRRHRATQPVHPDQEQS